MTSSKTAIPQIRVCISQLPAIIGTLLAQKMEAENIEVVEMTDQVDLVLFESLKDEIDILILGVRQALPPQKLIGDLLRIAPGLRILVLQHRDDVIVEYWLGIRYFSTQVVNVNEAISRIQALYTRDVMEMEWQDG